MAKQKKRKKKQSSSRGKGRSRSRSGSRWLEKQVAAAEGLYDAGKYEETFELLLPLVERYPRQPDLLALLFDVAFEIKKWRAAVMYGERLYPTEEPEIQAAILNNLMYAYIQLGLPALAWETASTIVAEHPDFEHWKQAQEFVEETEPDLREHFSHVEMVLERFRGDWAKVFGFMVEHDRMRFFVEGGDSKETVLRCRRLVAKVPGFVPALNNLSLAYFALGDVENAIETAQGVLDREPENYHALSNLVRYRLFNGETEAARKYATKLVALGENLPDRWLKQAEALAYMGDDEGVRVAYLQAKQHDWLDSPLLLHLAAAAHYRLRDEAEAWRLWEKALQIDPSFYMAQKSFADRTKKVGERDAGWYWTLEHWFGGRFQTSFDKLWPKNGGREAKTRAVRHFLKEYPQLPSLAPHILDRGDRYSREVMISLIEVAGTLELSTALLEFGLSRQGTNDQRMKALRLLSQHHPELLPADRQLSIWHEGKRRDVLLLGFEVYAEPKENILDDETFEIFLQAHEYLTEKRDAKQAEPLLMDVIKAYPDFPAAYNQLAMAYEMQGQYKKARTLVKKMHIRFPDYSFARIGLARMYLQEKRLDEARELLNPVLQQGELHVSELRVLAQAEILYALALENKDAAYMWLNMWERVEEDHPELGRWKARIENKGGVIRRMLRYFGW